MNETELSEAIVRMDAEIAQSKATMQTLVSRSKTFSRALSAGEREQFDRAEADVKELEVRKAELEVQLQDVRAASDAARRYGVGVGVGVGSFRTGREASPYRPNGEHSYFADLVAARLSNDPGAHERLARNNQIRNDERTRAGLTTTNGNAGEFVPPLWLEDEFIAAVRPARATADILTNLPLPPGTDQLNIPKISTGTAVAIQGTQNTGIQETDITTTSVTSGVYTVAGGQTLSVQLFDQSPIRGQIDRVILADLAADYAREIGSLVLNGTGSGQVVGLLGLAGTTAISYTDASPALMGTGKLYSKIASAVQAIQTSRYAPPTHIVMHPRRWAWICVQVDGNNRPAVLPESGGPFNASGIATSVNEQGAVGRMFNLPVVTDPNLPTNLGTGTNQDPIIVLRAPDSWLWESHMRADVFPQTYAQNASLYARIYNYHALVHRYAPSIAIVNGTGTVAPSF